MALDPLRDPHVRRVREQRTILEVPGSLTKGGCSLLGARLALSEEAPSPGQLEAAAPPPPL